MSKTGAVIVRRDFPALMAADAKKLYNQYSENIVEEFKELYKMDTSDKAYETSLGFIGMGNPVLTAELQLPVYDAPRMGRPVSYVHAKYRLSVAFSFESRDDDRYGKISRALIPELLRRYKVERNQQAADLLGNAFTAQGYEPDGVALVSNAHPPLRGTAGNQTNLLTLPLSAAGLQQARTLLRKNRDETGTIDPLTPAILVVGPSQESLAMELTQSSLKPGQTSNGTTNYVVTPNDINTAKGMRYIVMNYLPDNGMYFVLADERSLIWYDRQKAMADTEIDLKAQAVHLHASARWSRGFDNYRGVVGYPGS